MAAKRRVIDFTDTKEPPKFRNGKEKTMTPKQIRARARRHQKITEAELNELYKPIGEWDEEELARGRPRAADGTFRGKAPQWITRQMHEEALSRFKHVVEGKMRGETVTALTIIHSILTSKDVDEKNKPIVPAGTKLDAAKFLIEHVVGKPTQRQEVDVSVRLQALLAMATASPLDEGVGALSMAPGLAYEAAFGDDDDDDIADPEGD